MQEGRSKHACCFAVEVFDDEEFDPSAFVASTRSLVPLERLRDDLQEHLMDRKQELYDLINRDYADFILVSTKLSGVGGKVSQLREPMARLLARASGLRSAAEVEASKLEAKLEERRAVRERKSSVERFLRFMSTLDTAEGVLGIGERGADRLEDDMDTAGRDSGGSEALAGEGGAGVGSGAADGRAFWDVEDGDEGFDDPDLLAAFPGELSVAADPKVATPATTLVVDGSRTKEEEEHKAAAIRAQEECSLLERAAHYALMMNADLQAAAEDEANKVGDADATSLLRGMSSRASRVEAEITRRLRSEFASLLKPRQHHLGGGAPQMAVGGGGGGGGVGAGTEAGDGVVRESRRQALLSCLRPFSALGSGIEAEKQFARAVMQPFLEARFTPGIVDGGERGSSKGLGPLLNELLAYVKEALLERGFASLMDSQRLPELKVMYQLFQRVHALDELKTAMTAYVQSRGLYIVHDKENDKEMVANLLTFRAKLDVCVNTACDGNESYKYKLKEAWEAFLNARHNRPAELMAKFLDQKLKGEKGMSDDDVEGVLDKVMVLFRYLQGKDVFEAFYKRDLAKRLLLGKSSSFDLERSMISKLKTECGSAFTSKLEGMFKDIDLSRDLMATYSTYLKAKLDDRTVFKLDKSREMDLHVQVLTTGYWPAYPAMEVEMPEEMREHVECFKCYYQNKYQGRRLVWQPVLGQCIMKVAFPKGRKELAVSQLQTLVLWCFSAVDEMSFVDIKAKTNIEDGELRRTLQSLACGKVRVLHKEPRGRDVNDGDKFLFNKDFTAKLHRIRINSIQLKETAEENEKTHEAVFRDRQYQVDAAIVRIMKARKNLAHTLLMGELFSQVKFPATPVDLKKRIESLIERDYLERDPNKPGEYRYLA